jgi:hypothetical protein
MPALSGHPVFDVITGSGVNVPMLDPRPASPAEAGDLSGVTRLQHVGFLVRLLPDFGTPTYKAMLVSAGLAIRQQPDRVTCRT